MSQNFSFRQAAVIGAGTMGRGIVMCLANAGLDVQWLDSNPQMLNQALGAVADTYAHNVRQGRIGEEEAAARRARITPVQHLAAMREADLVIEAVYENLELKQSIFRELDAALKPSAVLASNTSYLDIDAIATGETWYGTQAVENHLIDAVGTSDDYILAHLQSHQLVQLEEHVPECWLDKIKHRILGKIQARPLKARLR